MNRSTLAVACAVAALAAAPAAPASASAPAPFPVYDASGSVLVTAHPVTSGERLVIKGRPVELAWVAHPGPAYVAHVLGEMPVSWRHHMLAAVLEP